MPSYDFAFIVSQAAPKFPKIREFLNAARAKFSPEELSEIQLYSWIEIKSLGILFRFNFQDYRANYLQWFAAWERDLQLRFIELEKLSEKERTNIVEKFSRTSDMKFTGSYDFDLAVNIIERKLKTVEDLRKEPRLGTRMKVVFNTEDSFYKEYSTNLSFGGMFIKSKKKPPLRTRLEIAFSLPNKDEVRVEAEVIHIVDAEKSENLNCEEGFGVRFVEFLDDGKKKLKDYYDKLTKIKEKDDKQFLDLFKSIKE
jgi:type IV pilus assembly protein PilZ